MNPVQRAAIAAWKPQDLRTPWEWSEENIVVDNTSPMPGRWRSATSPWVKEPMEVAADKRVTFVAIRCSAQSSKTQTILNLICWDIVEDPGPEMYVMANQEDAVDFVRDRFQPTLKNCQPANALLLREGKLGFTFRTMPLYFVGAGSMAKLQGKPIKRLKLDEVRNYPPGALDTVLKRIRAFDQLAQVFLISTPDMLDDAVDRSFKQGDQRTFHFPCPACGHIQQLRFAQLKWDTNDQTKPNGKWHFDNLAQTIRFECEKCSYSIRDTPTERKRICRDGRFIRMNPNAPAHHVSFTWNALLPWWVRWRSIVEEFLHARAAARAGDLQPLKTFVNETLGEPWDDQLGAIEDFDFLDARKADYDFGDTWPEELVRFMAADRQEAGGEHYWYAIRAFGPFGKSRLIAYGRCSTREQLEDIRKQHNVTAANAMLDSGFKASEVYRFCLATGWKAFKGDDADFFLHKDLRSGRTVRRLFQRTFVDPFFGTRHAGRRKPLPLFRWSNNAAKDLLAEHMAGLVGEWTLPRSVARDYLKQITAEIREEVVDTRGRLSHRWKQIRRDNHLLDCELMLTVAAVITKLIASVPGSSAGGAASSAGSPLP